MIEVVDASTPPALELPSPTSLVPPLIAVAADPTGLASDHWLETASFTLTEAPTRDRRCVRVDSIDDAVAAITQRCAGAPIGAGVCADVLRAVDPEGDVRAALVTESLAYSTLQAGPEFADWAQRRGPVAIEPPGDSPTVVYTRDGDTLRIILNRPHRHNAFTDSMRILLLEALTLAHLDTTISAVELRGAGKSFCSGGDLAEFGAFDDPAASHIARTRFSPALALDSLRRRIGPRLRARLHGQVLGSGLEMAAFCGHLVAHPDSRFALPEINVGLIPGAGGTYSVPRRIGRHRTAYLILSGAALDAATALDWGLVDEVDPAD